MLAPYIRTTLTIQRRRPKKNFPMDFLVRSGLAVAVVTLQSIDEIKAIIALFAEIAREQSWQPGDQLSAYQDCSTYFALKCGSEWIGGLQLVLAGKAAMLPCLTVWPELQLLGRPEVADIAMLALRQQYRGQRLLFWLLCIEMWRYCEASGISQLWVEVTPTNLRLYRRLGWPLKIVGPLRPHWGEDCLPCWMSIEEIDAEMAQRAERSQSYRTIYELMHRDEQSSIPASLLSGSASS